MGDQHLSKLEGALSKRGWSIIDREENVDWTTSGKWRLQRSSKVPPTELIFDGMNPMGTAEITPMPSAHGCFVDGPVRFDLHFSKLRNWYPELEGFLEKLDTYESDLLSNNDNPK
jgi:hypothetical protein